MRNNRFGWVDTGSLPFDSTAGDESTLTALGIADSVFTGVTVGGSNEVDLWDVDGVGGQIDRLGGIGPIGGGEVLATVDGGTALGVARFPTASALAATGISGSTATTHGGERIFLAMHAGSPSDDPANLSDDGRIVLDNALIEFGLEQVPEPSASLLIVLSGFLLARRKRC